MCISVCLFFYKSLCYLVYCRGNLNITLTKDLKNDEEKSKAKNMEKED